MRTLSFPDVRHDLHALVREARDTLYPAPHRNQRVHPLVSDVPPPHGHAASDSDGVGSQNWYYRDGFVPKIDHLGLPENRVDIEICGFPQENFSATHGLPGVVTQCFSAGDDFLEWMQQLAE